MMWTIVKMVNKSAFCLEHVIDAQMYSPYKIFTEVSPCHTGLVGDNYGFYSIFIYYSYCLKGEGIELKLFESAQISHLFIYCSVSVKEDRSILFYHISIKEWRISGCLGCRLMQFRPPPLMYPEPLVRISSDKIFNNSGEVLCIREYIRFKVAGIY